MEFASTIVRRVTKALVVAAFFAAFSSVVQADPVIVTITNPTQAGVFGTTFSFSGTITNLNSSPLTFIEADLATVPVGGPFSAGLNPPELINLFVPAFSTTPVMPLLTVTIDVNFQPGTYNLVFWIVGSAGNSVITSNQAPFTITILPNTPTAVPEPATMILLAAGLSGLGVIRLQKSKAS